MEFEVRVFKDVAVVQDFLWQLVKFSSWKVLESRHFGSIGYTNHHHNRGRE
jgi:hypothetical protein